MLVCFFFIFFDLRRLRCWVGKVFFLFIGNVGFRKDIGKGFEGNIFRRRKGIIGMSNYKERR